MRIKFTCKAVLYSLMAGVLGVMASGKSDAQEIFKKKAKGGCKHVKAAKECTRDGKTGADHDKCTSHKTSNSTCENCGRGTCLVKAKPQVRTIDEWEEELEAFPGVNKP